MAKNLKYGLYKILKNITFGKLRDYFAQKVEKQRKLFHTEVSLITDLGQNNIYDKKLFEKFGIKLFIEGDNNSIKISENAKINHNVYICIYGSNNTIDLGDIVVGSHLKMFFGTVFCKTQNAEVKIGNMTKLVNVDIMLLEDKSRLLIGEDCLISEDVYIHLSDGHSILDLEGNLLNAGGEVILGDRVWVGRGVKILKQVKIANDTVIGTGSIVTKEFDEPNVIIAGIPAKVIKKGIKWTCEPPQFYKNEREKTRV